MLAINLCFYARNHLNQYIFLAIRTQKKMNVLISFSKFKQGHSYVELLISFF